VGNGRSKSPEKRALPTTRWLTATKPDKKHSSGSESESESDNEFVKKRDNAMAGSDGEKTYQEEKEEEPMQGWI